MPIYEYQCEDCGFRHERIQKVSDPVLKKCPSCHQMALKKLISAGAFRLKGSGWYETDFKSGSKKNVLGGQEKAADSSDSADKPKTGGEGDKADKKPKPEVSQTKSENSATSNK